jgi:hypothetical protein
MTLLVPYAGGALSKLFGGGAYSAPWAPEEHSDRIAYGKNVVQQNSPLV